jgi:hypothetical protein
MAVLPGFLHSGSSSGIGAGVPVGQPGVLGGNAGHGIAVVDLIVHSAEYVLF